MSACDAWHMLAQSGNTALIWAAMRGHADCARLLLDAGADTEVKDNVRASAVCMCTAVTIDCFVRKHTN